MLNHAFTGWRHHRLMRQINTIARHTQAIHSGRCLLLALTGATLLAMPLAANAQAKLPDIVPLPFARPQSAPGPFLDRAPTGSVVSYSAAMASDPREVALQLLRDGLDALAAGDIARARAVRDGLAPDSIDRIILTWAIAGSGHAAVGSTEIADAIKALADWPGSSSLRAGLERALWREDPGPRAALAAFADVPPRTSHGAMLLARAHLATGRLSEARDALVPTWRRQRLDIADETAILREFSTILTTADHRFRMERMLYADRFPAAERAAALAEAEELAKAFIAVSRNEANAAAMLDAVPEAQRGAAWTFAKARHLRRTGKDVEAAETMLTAPTSGDALVDPDAWWVERRVLSRELVDLGDIPTAYKLAATHAAESPAQAVDAEFHAGWYAFRGMGDAKKGATHFARIAEIAEGPISLSRAHYWLGRAAEKGGPGEAREHFERAATYGTAFYGQLAAAKLGRTAITIDTPVSGDAERKRFEARPAVKAIARLEQAGHGQRADAIYRALAEELESAGELALLVERAERRGSHFLALRVAKWAAARGLDIGTLTHPTGAIPDDAQIAGAGKALAYAIARQESEFNAGARSGAGALGLLQLLPGTAREMARKTGVAYSQARLTADAGYNAALGAAYLDEQLGRFDGSYVMTFAGYNAGPRRAREWAERYGDPRGKSIETVVDWIERIPFTETRSYVQRVMENYQVYKMRLTGRMDIAADLVHGR